MYFFTSDQHLGHAKIIQYCHRPFSNVEEMNSTIIERFNSVVGKNDTTVHAGDFCWAKNHKEAQEKYISKLNGNHIFIKGSHDHWLPDFAQYMWRKEINGVLIVVCHYSMRTWERSHYNSWHLYGHSHGRLEPFGKSMDIGVDPNNFYPLSFEQIREYMNNRPNNFNFVGYK